ncbi:hypothetical protein BDN72DRAFT_501189 [Pluteus cervinus]|uniref:Uncharacterized protein n=1 Tax=Pluteus cervinus TaxID=181527 RepID=A0ACD3A587_9AGAR|nr:hypothetical protein BDN72DRAFT_501189 [Pluteus cervinus]
MDPLAPELIGLIFQHIITDCDPRELANTFRTCCLVSRKWREIAQPLLFSEYPRFREHSSEELFRILDNQPHLQPHIKNLWIHTEVWFEEPLYKDMFRRLAPRLRTLVVTNQVTGGILGGIPLPISEAIISCLSTNILTSLSFSEVIGFPISIFYQLPCLRELHLHASTPAGFSIHDADGKLKFEFYSTPRLGGLKPKLFHLFIEDANSDQINILDWFIHVECAFDVSELKTFHGFESPDSVWQALYISTIRQKFVKFVSSSLQNLALSEPGRLC